MNPERSLFASFWTIVLVNTLGTVDMPMTGGKRLMPAPRNYMAIVVVWGSLGLVADTGSAERGRAAAIVGWVLVATSLIGNVVQNRSGQIGVAGLRLTGFINSFTNLLRGQQQQQQEFQGGTGGGTFSPSGGTPGGINNRTIS